MLPYVLVADTDMELADLIRSYLRARGFSVDSATTGLECLEHVRRRTPDVLVLCEELLGGGGDGVSPVLYDAVDSAIPAVVLTTGEDSVAPLGPRPASLVTCLRKASSATVTGPR